MSELEPDVGVDEVGVVMVEEEDKIKTDKPIKVGLLMSTKVCLFSNLYGLMMMVSRLTCYLPYSVKILECQEWTPLILDLLISSCAHFHHLSSGY